METRWRRALGITLVLISAVTAGCPTGSTDPNATAAGSTSGSSSTTSTTTKVSPTLGGTSAAATFLNAGSVKVIFNKIGFFSNSSPSPLGCAGDARLYFDPRTDRQVPVRPLWLKNVGLDITNSNAFHGPSRASGCSLSGVGSPPASNCAAFDDQQPLSGLSSRSVLVGGYGCALGTANCSPVALTNDVWNLIVPDTTTSATWGQQAAGLPSMPPPPATPGPTLTPGIPGVAWHGGGYDELHDQFYIFGGATPGGNSSSSPGVFSNQVTRISFTADSTVSTNPMPTLVRYSSRHFYASWARQSYDANLATFFPPPAMTGSTFTYGLRRDPSMKTNCTSGEVVPSFISLTAPTSGGSCTASNVPGGITAVGDAVATNEHHDFYLLQGGMQTNGIFNKSIYLFKPHGFSNDIGTGAGVTPVVPDGDWNLVSNVTAAGMSQKVMKVVDLSVVTDITSSVPYITTEVGGLRQQGDIFSGWLGRAYHQTVYDPGMGRFITFGGLENHNANLGAALPATTVAPDLAANDVWIYDAPALGRRPTSICFSDEMPDGTQLNNPTRQLAAGSSVKPMGASRNLGPNANYARAPFVFPPGGCMQRIKMDDISASVPPKRFAHGQVFDSDDRVMFVFGGCNGPQAIRGNNSTNAGDPIFACPAQSLLNDIWVYVPPSTTELVSQTFTTTNPGPYNALTLLGNIFGTDFWLDHLPLFTGTNDPTNAVLRTPERFRVLGNWIKLTPPTSSIPSPRAGAAISYDRAHHKIYVQGGFGCPDANCVGAPRTLNDLWEYTPPNFDTTCPNFRSDGFCGSNGFGQGSWYQINIDNAASNTTQPTERYGGIMSFANQQISHGDEFYTITDTSCQFQGPIASPDANVNKQLVGAIYVDIDRNQMAATDNLLINLRFLPFDKKTRLPGWSDNGTQFTTIDDTDAYSTQDTALIRVQLLNDQLKVAEQIQSTVQPRFHEFISGTPTIASEFMFIAGATGQVTEKQIHVPLTLDPTLNLIKIERLSGSIKFFEMTISKF